MLGFESWRYLELMREDVKEGGRDKNKNRTETKQGIETNQGRRAKERTKARYRGPKGYERAWVSRRDIIRKAPIVRHTRGAVGQERSLSPAPNSRQARSWCIGGRLLRHDAAYKMLASPGFICRPGVDLDDQHRRPALTSPANTSVDDTCMLNLRITNIATRTTNFKNQSTD